ncbi:hypothetical protein NECAME_15205 [Necator americanus]|uniref:Uncharacterized protein n=1 Tax=Necator americanus TaxID=51031 RepID=W2SJ94_NECAM|nr:hypothetical protein NECAME_15205 [Necator americanus]ETN69638.1 hypothetical protein NECAME_15205 [Necator americanus]
MQWLKNKDECGGSSLFMTYFSFAGTVYFGVDAAFSIIGSLILYFTKKSRMLSRYVLITIVVSFVFVIIEGIALAISILLSLDTSCLNEKPVQTFFVASWILVMVAIFLFGSILLCAVFSKRNLGVLESVGSAESRHDDAWQ